MEITAAWAMWLVKDLYDLYLKINLFITCCASLLEGLYDGCGFPYPSGDRFCRSCSDSAVSPTASSDKRTANVE